MLTSFSLSSLSCLSLILPICLPVCPTSPHFPHCVPPDFNYNTDGYEGDGAEDGKSQDGSETMPFIDESPTMSPQLCAPRGPDGETVSPTPPEGLLPGVRTHSRSHTHSNVGMHECIHTANIQQSSSLKQQLVCTTTYGECLQIYRIQKKC